VWVLALLLLSVPWSVEAASAPTVAKAATAASRRSPSPEKVTSVEGITEYRLANGLRVLFFPDPSKQTTTVNITYLVGSRHEGYGETGMAHLLEHMVFKGTPKHPNIAQELTAHGCRPNGTTWFDRTNYFETFAATEENLDWALDLEADRMIHSFIAQKDLNSEMTVVRNEFEVGENYPREVLYDRIMSAAYLWHNYGKSTIGSRSDIERVPIRNLQAFYRQWYQPDNAMLVVAGKFDEPKTLQKVARIFGAIPKPTRVLPNTYTLEPAQDGERTVTLRRVGDVQVVAAAYHVPAGPDADFAAVDVLAYILGDTPSGRLHKALVEPKKASSVFGFGWQLHDPGTLIVGAELRKESSIEAAREIVLRVAEGLTTEPPTEQEVNRARDNRLKSWHTTIRNSERAALSLSEWAAMGDWRLMFLHRDHLQAVKPEDVARVARAYLKPENRTVGMYLPTQEPMRIEVPQAPEVAALVHDYKGGEGLAMGEAFDPAPAAIEARAIRAKVAPGIKLVMVPKKTRGSTVQMTMTLHFGDQASLQGRGTAGDFVASMLMRGTKKQTREQIQAALDHLKTQMSVGGWAASASLSFETTRENLPASLRLAAELLREPAFPPAELDLLRQESLARTEDSRSDPAQKASTALQKHLRPWPKTDPRYTESPEEEIQSVRAVTLQDVQSFYQDFYGASAAEAAIVGDFDAKEIQGLVGELFKGWENKQPFTRLVTTFEDRPAHTEAIEAPDKESANFQAGLRVKMRDDSPDYPAMVLGNFMIGGGFINSRLATRLRQKDGLCYGVGSFFSASSFDEDASFGSRAIYAPQNAERLMAGFREELDRAVRDGFAAKEIAEAKQGWLQGRVVSRATDRELAGTLAAREYQGRTLAFDEALEKQVAALTGDAIGAALKKYIDPAKISTIQSGDFAKAKGKASEAKTSSEVR
jgi:zinc protease